MNALLRFFHGLFVLGLVLILTLGIGIGLPSAVTFHHITDAAIVTDWLARGDVHAAIVRAGFLTSLEDIHTQAETLPPLDNEALADRYLEGFPLAVAQQAIDAVVFSFYDYLSGRTETVELVLNAEDFQPIVTYIQRDGAQIITDYVEQLPNCPGQPDDLDRYYRGECVPTDLPHAELVERFQGYWQVEHDHLSNAPFFQSEFDDYESLSGGREFFRFARSFTEWWLAGLLLTCLLLVYVRRDRLRGMRDLRTCWVVGTILSILLVVLFGFLLHTVLNEMEITAPASSSDLLFRDSFQRVTMIAFRIIAAQTVLAGLLGSSLSWTALRWSRQLKKAR